MDLGVCRTVLANRGAQTSLVTPKERFQGFSLPAVTSEHEGDAGGPGLPRAQVSPERAAPPSSELIQGCPHWAPAGSQELKMEPRDGPARGQALGRAGSLGLGVSGRQPGPCQEEESSICPRDQAEAWAVPGFPS